jgi:transcriptional repressor NF-X1
VNPGRGGARKAPAPTAAVAPPVTSGAAAAAGETPAAGSRSQVMAQQLKNGAYECMICTETIRHAVATWSCRECYRVFHLFCVKKWAKSDGSGVGVSFRCPSCQTQFNDCPNRYYCFCGKQVDPQPDAFITPHTCGDTCGRKRRNGCPHPCPLQCHPGPCAECTAIAPPVRCPCGQSQYTYPCGKPDPKKTCGGTCGKLLGCKNHRCADPCHHGPCRPCQVTPAALCRCGKEERTVTCGAPEFSCNKPCGKTQRCGNHQCPTLCHDGACPPCDTDPAVVFTCPCGKQPLRGPRKLCTDPVPTCESVCGRVLLCGEHKCGKSCHEGPCPTCDANVQLRCRCANTQKRVICGQVGELQCNKQCKARLDCGRHECQVICCAHRRSADPTVHHCSRVCGKQLPCGHPCDEPCHRGACPPCVNIVTDELACACGNSVLMPPQPCGTQPPQCDMPCPRMYSTCDHTPLPHNCHFGACPPCTAKVDRDCVGGHTVVRAVMCSSGPVSCGNACKRALPCGHGCPLKCHGGECVDPAKPRKCVQPCGATLPCGHSCKAKCHADRPGQPCPPCTSTEELPCECGFSRVKLTCAEFQQRLAETPPEAAVVGKCTTDCDHKRRLAALDPGMRGEESHDRFGCLGQSHQGPRAAVGTLYSFNLWDIAQHNLANVTHAEKYLAEFVRSQAKDKMLPPMQLDKRVAIHELAQYFHVDTESVDREPKRSIQLIRHAYSRIPTRLLSHAASDPAADPSVVCQNVLTHRDAATRCIIVFEGLADVITDRMVFRILRLSAGQFILVEQPMFPRIFPNGNVPQPNQGHRGEATTAIVAVFAKGNDASQAFSNVRKHGCPLTFHWFGEGPPPTNFSNHELGIKGARPSAARFFCDEASSTFTDGAAKATRPTSVPQPGSASWASVARRETARQKERSRPGEVETGNKFAALGR